MWPFSNPSPGIVPSDSDRLRAEGELRRIENGVVGKDDLVAAVMAVSESRRAQADRLLWEIPALGLTAQAFLSTIALDPTATDAARLVASLTALIFIGAAFQSLLKHRYHEGMWARWLELFEQKASLPQLNSLPTVDSVARSGPSPDLEEPSWLYGSPLYLLKPYGFGRRVFKGSAFRVWATALVAVIVIDALMVVIALLGLASNVNSPFSAPVATQKPAAARSKRTPSPSIQAVQGQHLPSR